MEAGETVTCEGFHGMLWSEELEADGTAEETVRYKGGQLDGLPAVLRKGRAWYVSTLPEPEALRGALARSASAASVRPVLDGLPEQVEAVRRGGVLFVLNHGLEPVTVDVPGTHRDLLTGAAVTDRVTVGRYAAVAALRP
ncbi:Beta-galactosidase C-terminal domain [Streptomyces sp. R33]|uniref:Beta-galactosidase C-terminal domain n=1 Tax=Streptomyces sp. R33 TaxID=3238629 RepID=UPI00350FC6EE